jgi:hypothetical protein
MNIETLIREANPVATSDLAAGDSPHARRVLARILEAPARTRWISGKVPRLTLTAVAAAGVAAVVISSLPGSPAPLGGPNQAAGALRKLALAADAQPASRPPGPGQFWYVSSRSLTLDDLMDPPAYTVAYDEQRQIWEGASGYGRIVDIFRHPRFPTRHDRINWLAAGRPSLALKPTIGRSGGMSSPTTVGHTNLWTLTTDPGRLAALISARKIEGGPPGAAEDFTQVADMFREKDMPVALRAALFRVAASIPGVWSLGTVTDHEGTSGIGIAYVSHARGHLPAGSVQHNELIFDPATSALISEQYVLVNLARHTSKVMAWTDYLSEGLVNSITSTPAATPGP